MSGSKQHYIPQLLLRRFGRPRPGRDKVQVWVYPADRPPFFSATDGVAAQRFFYSALSDAETLDDRITRHEDAVSTDLADLDRTATGEAADAGAAARVIAHLTVRNAHTRRTFQTAGLKMADEGLELFKDPAWVARAAGLDEPEPSKALQNMMREEAAKIPGGAALLAMPGIEAALHAQMKTAFADQQPMIAAMTDALQHRMRAELPDRVRTAHGAALDQSLAPEARMQALQALTWTVEDGPPDGMILPDCVALARIDGDEAFVPAIFVTRTSVIDAVYLPLSPERLLIGAPDRASAPGDWNERAAAASMDFFVARDRDAALAALTATMGGAVAAFLDRALGGAFAEDPAGLLERKPPERIAPAPARR